MGEPGRQVPFFRPDVGAAEKQEVLAALESGWLTSGPRTREFAQRFARAVGAEEAVAVNSCTAALHLGVEALGLRANQAVLVPTMTFAATAEVVRYLGAVPVLVDCDPVTCNLDLDDATAKLDQLRAGRLLEGLPTDLVVAGIIPVHVGGYMMDMAKVRDFAVHNKLWIVEDAAHAFPAAWRSSANAPWQRCGENTADVTCYSFYANKTITTGEGGMATTDDAALADRMRLMSLHGMSRDAWTRYTAEGSWDYSIVAPGFKYNMTDLAAALGLQQLARADAMRLQREQIVHRYLKELRAVDAIELPPDNDDRVHAWHLFPIRLSLDKLTIDRKQFIEELKTLGIGCSVHWRPLHLHPYYRDTFGWRAEQLPVASAVWPRLVSLPLFSGMSDEECTHVVDSVAGVCRRFAR